MDAAAPERKWTAVAAVADGLGRATTPLLPQRRFTALQTWGDTTLGMVTGNNQLLRALARSASRELGLRQTDLIPLSPPGSAAPARACRSPQRRSTELGATRAADVAVPPGRRALAGGRAYIAAGEAAGVRPGLQVPGPQPWWRVPLVPPADLLLTYMNADTPRLSTNRAAGAPPELRARRLPARRARAARPATCCRSRR